MSGTEQRARRLLGDDVTDTVLANAQNGPPLTQAQLDFIARAFGPLIWAGRNDNTAADAA